MNDPTYLRDAIESHPFAPFVIHIADGRSIQVTRKGAIAISEDLRTIACMTGKFCIIDVALVTGIDYEMSGNVPAL
jgi:hypothetical protein